MLNKNQKRFIRIHSPAYHTRCRLTAYNHLDEFGQLEQLSRAKLQHRTVTAGGSINSQFSLGGERTCGKRCPDGEVEEVEVTCLSPDLQS
jgi:hypothetical protein